MFQQEPWINEGAKWAGYRMYSAQGMAKIMAAFGTDMPMMSAKGREYFALMYDIGLGYGYTYSDVMAAAMSGTPLDNMLALNTREAHERTVSNLLWRGNKEYQIIGFIEHPNIPLVAVAGAWATTDGDKICDDVSAIIAAVNTTKIYEVNEFHMPSKAWARIQGLRLSGTLGTVLSFLRTSYPEVTFRKTPIWMMTVFVSRWRITAATSHRLPRCCSVSCQCNVVGLTCLFRACRAPLA